MPDRKLAIDSVVNRLFAENTFIIHWQDASECVLVDPGSDTDALVRKVTEKRLTPSAILITHGHSDHIMGNESLRRIYPDCPIVIGHGDAHKLTDPVANLSAQYGIDIKSPPADLLLKEGDVYQSAGFDWEILETPGHSPGHIVFVLKDHDPWLVIGGDVLFEGSIGRTDFADGSMEDLVASIHNKLFTMPDNTLVLTGHGQPTSIGIEKQTNPFVGIPAGYKPSA